MAMNPARSPWRFRLSLLLDAFVTLIGIGCQVGLIYALSFFSSRMLLGIWQHELTAYIASGYLNMCRSFFPASLATLGGWTLALSPLLVFSFSWFHAAVRGELGNFAETGLFTGLTSWILPTLVGVIAPAFGISMVTSFHVAGILASLSHGYYVLEDAVGTGSLLQWVGKFINPRMAADMSTINMPRTGMDSNLEGGAEADASEAEEEASTPRRRVASPITPDRDRRRRASGTAVTPPTDSAVTAETSSRRSSSRHSKR